MNSRPSPLDSKLDRTTGGAGPGAGSVHCSLASLARVEPETLHAWLNSTRAGTHFQLLPAVHVPKMSPNHELLIGEASFKALSYKLKPELGSRTRVPDHCLSKCWALKLPDPLKEQYLLDYVRLLESLLPTFPEGIQVPFLPSNPRVVAPVAERA